MISVRQTSLPAWMADGPSFQFKSFHRTSFNFEVKGHQKGL